MKILKNRIFLVLATAIIVGSITAYATISPNSESIIYDNTNSGLTSTNMQDAIDELYRKAKNSGGLSDFDKFGYFDNTSTSYVVVDTGLDSISTAQRWMVLIIPSDKTQNSIFLYHPANATTVAALSNGYSSAQIQDTLTPTYSKYGVAYVGISEGKIAVNVTQNGSEYAVLSPVGKVYWGIDEEL